MKKCIGLFLSLLLLSVIPLQAQLNATGLEGKKISLEADIGISLFPSALMFLGHGISQFEGAEDLFSIKYNFELGYTLTNKIKASLLYTKSNFSIDEVSDQVLESGYDEFFIDYEFKDAQFNSFGIKGSYFVRDFIAPVGGSLGVSVKRSSINIKDHVFTEMEFRTDGGYWQDENYILITKDTADLSASYFTMGLHYENMIFLSSKNPIYMKYGMSTALRFGKKVKRADQKLDLTEDSNNIYNEFLGRDYQHSLFEFTFGLGYIF